MIVVFRCSKILGEAGKQKNYDKCSENSRSQIVFRTDIFRKLSLGAPDYTLQYKHLSVCDSSLRYRSHTEITVLLCERKPFPMWFSCCRRKSYPVVFPIWFSCCRRYPVVFPIWFSCCRCYPVV